MKSIIYLLSISFLLFSCNFEVPEDDAKEDDVENQDDNAGEKEDGNEQEVSFDINMEELYGDWVMIGVGADRIGPGIAPVGEILFAFRDNGNMTVATEGRSELEVNLAGIPSPYTIDDKKLCSDDIMFKMQFKQECAEVIRLNEGRMSIEIEIPGGGLMYKHFVKLD